MNNSIWTIERALLVQKAQKNLSIHVENLDKYIANEDWKSYAAYIDVNELYYSGINGFDDYRYFQRMVTDYNYIYDACMHLVDHENIDNEYTKEPVRQGLVSMTGTFIDTIVICTMTGLSIVITETWNTGLEGVAITTAAFQKGLPFPAQFASFALMLCLVFFAFTTILGWDYYGERCLEYLFNRNMTAVKT